MNNNPTVSEKRRQKGLSARQEKALAVLVSGGSCQEAAEAAGVTRQTISEWRSDPLFILEHNKAVNAIRQAALIGYQDRIAELVNSSLSTLLSAIKGGDSVSARFVLERAIGLQETVSDKFNEIVNPPQFLTENIDTIIEEIANNIMTELAEKEGLTELEILSKHDQLKEAKQKLVAVLQQEYQERSV